MCELRWGPPLPTVPWQGVREATEPGSACTQRAEGLVPFIAPMAKAYGSSFAQPPVQSSEDCLYLDVWVPQWPAKQALPVMVWLHGGSNTVGSGSQSTYGGVSLTRHGVVLVTLNYRLGVMGFFSHPELSKESAHHSSGNYGLLDQLAALAWVKRNIAQFGGDPDNVTLFGESAGAIDAALLMTSPLSAGLFRHVISESGPAFGPARTLSEAEAFGSAVSALTPADPHLTALQRLRALPAAEVEKLVVKAKEHFPADITSATTDGWVLPRSPQQAFLSGSIQKVDLLIGLNGRELSAFRLAAAAASKSSGNQSSVAESGGFKKFSAAARPYFGGCTASTDRFQARARLNSAHSTAWKFLMCSEAWLTRNGNGCHQRLMMNRSRTCSRPIGPTLQNPATPMRRDYPIGRPGAMPRWSFWWSIKMRAFRLNVISLRFSAGWLQMNSGKASKPSKNRLAPH